MTVKPVVRNCYDILLEEDFFSFCRFTFSFLILNTKKTLKKTERSKIFYFFLVFSIKLNKRTSAGILAFLKKDCHIFGCIDLLNILLLLFLVLLSDSESFILKLEISSIFQGCIFIT